MADEAESSRRAAPMTPPQPPPPSPAIPEDSSSEANMYGASDDCSSNTPEAEFLSLWMSSYTALPEPEAEEDPLEDVSPLLNFDVESSFPDLLDLNTTSTAVTQAPVTQAPAVTQPLWMQLQAPVEGEVDDLSRLALGIQSSKSSILPLTLGIQFSEAPVPAPVSPQALGIQFPEAAVAPLALGIYPSPTFEIQSPQAPISPLALGIQPPPASSGKEASQASLSAQALGLQRPQASFGTQSPHSFVGIQTPQAPISPLAPEIQSSVLPLARGIQFPQASISPPIPPLARGIQSPRISFGIQSPPVPFSSLPPIPCPLPKPPALRHLPSIPCTLPVAPPLWNFLPRPSPVPERRSWSVFPNAPPPARGQLLLLPHSASASASSPSSHLSHQPRYFLPDLNAAYQQHVHVAHVPVTFATPNANASFYAGFVPASRPSWSPAMMPRRSWTTPNPPRISSGGLDMKLPIPRRCPRFPFPPAAATMPATAPLLANIENFVGTTPGWNARGDAPAGDHQRVQTGESSRKRSKLAVQT